MNVVIMAGGKGTRFWPLSVKSMPKQFISLYSQHTLIQETVSRFRKLVDDKCLFIATPRCYLPLLADQLHDIKPNQIIVEPQQKDTAACMALVAYHFLQRSNDEPLVFVPSDQSITDDNSYFQAILHAVSVAQKPCAIVTVGIPPDRAETSFGYLDTIPAADLSDDKHVLRVARFIEKPAAEQAEELFRRPNVYWNSGVFVWRPSTIAYYMQQHAPDLWESIISGHNGSIDDAYEALPSLSIDYSIIEKVDDIYCVPVQCGWDDIGSWAAVRRHLKPDRDGNVRLGPARLANSSDNTVYTEQDALIVGVSGLIIVSTPNGLLICPQSEEHRLKYWINESLR